MKKFALLFLITFFGLSSLMAQQFKTHAVKEGETIESISRLYKIKPADILRLNPELKGGLKVNTILVIPPSLEENKPIINAATTKQEVTFKQHRVRRKETLFSISQKYDIEIEDIKRFNKELYSRELKKGERIRIPKFLTPRVAENPADSIPEGLAKYIVQPKQGKWRIAYEHGITVKELEELNPELGEMLQEGQEIWVPAKELEEKNVVIDTLYNYYTVLPREGFFRLKLKLGTTQEQLEELNPELKDGGLKVGMILKIPKEIEGDFDVKDGLVVEKFRLIDSIRTDEVLNIGLIMPFNLNRVDLDSVSVLREQINGNRWLSRSLDFYAGARMALDSAKQLGISVNVKVYDSEANENVVSNLIANTDFEGTDAVIGPFFPGPFNEMARGLRTNNIPVFAPFTKNIDLAPNVFQTIPSDEVLYEKMVKYLDKRVEGKNLIIIADSLSMPTKERLLLRYPTAKVVDPIENRFIRLDELDPVLVEDQENWVIVETKSISLLANITSVLNSAHGTRLIEEEEKTFDIRMFTTNKNRAFDSDNVSNFHLSKLRFHYPTTDRLSSMNSEFSKEYERQYGSFPDRYAIRGFDLTMDVILRLAYNKNLYIGAERISETEYVENKFNYTRRFFGGYYNTAAYIAYYEELEIKIARDNDIKSNL
ncbi:LysM peptidoglycan-binding domain-containing protein [Leptobacterium flavescens]|uniref:LysM peptidoglycan-binding domain-containing protein n=1 Tax=Leptobacterium flavescens TaxID=472055 RepID=A0A6P0UMI8_9FLAO|nr:LysM peptidoglycan-binding domain-containing protein [Leptobacterium flavescens]NER12243.1 LysM peptidoglycan-binding domain-containing protein [Leptobacterium flavescens]